MWEARLCRSTRMNTAGAPLGGQTEGLGAAPTGGSAFPAFCWERGAGCTIYGARGRPTGPDEGVDKRSVASLPHARVDTWKAWAAAPDAPSPLHCFDATSCHTHTLLPRGLLSPCCLCSQGRPSSLGPALWVGSCHLLWPTTREQRQQVPSSGPEDLMADAKCSKHLQLREGGQRCLRWWLPHCVGP